MNGRARICSYSLRVKVSCKILTSCVVIVYLFFDRANRNSKFHKVYLNTIQSDQPYSLENPFYSQFSIKLSIKMLYYQLNTTI